MSITPVQFCKAAVNHSPSQNLNLPHSDQYAKMTKVAKLSFCALGITMGGVISAVGMLTGLNVVAHFYFNTTLGLTIYHVVKPIFFFVGSMSSFFALTFQLSPALSHAFTEPLGYLAAFSLVAPFLPLTIGSLGAAPGLIIIKHCYEKAIGIYNDHID